MSASGFLVLDTPSGASSVLAQSDEETEGGQSPYVLLHSPSKGVLPASAAALAASAQVRRPSPLSRRDTPTDPDDASLPYDPHRLALQHARPRPGHGTAGTEYIDAPSDPDPDPYPNSLSTSFDQDAARADTILHGDAEWPLPDYAPEPVPAPAPTGPSVFAFSHLPSMARSATAAVTASVTASLSAAAAAASTARAALAVGTAPPGPVVVPPAVPAVAAPVPELLSRPVPVRWARSGGGAAPPSASASALAASSTGAAVWPAQAAPGLAAPPAALSASTPAGGLVGMDALVSPFTAPPPGLPGGPPLGILGDQVGGPGQLPISGLPSQSPVENRIETPAEAVSQTSPAAGPSTAAPASAGRAAEAAELAEAAAPQASSGPVASAPAAEGSVTGGAWAAPASAGSGSLAASETGAAADSGTVIIREGGRQPVSAAAAVPYVSAAGSGPIVAGDEVAPAESAEMRNDGNGRVEREGGEAGEERGPARGAEAGVEEGDGNGDGDGEEDDDDGGGSVLGLLARMDEATLLSVPPALLALLQQLEEERDELAGRLLESDAELSSLRASYNQLSQSHASSQTWLNQLLTQQLELHAARRQRRQRQQQQQQRQEKEKEEEGVPQAPAGSAGQDAPPSQPPPQQQEQQQPPQGDSNRRQELPPQLQQQRQSRPQSRQGWEGGLRSEDVTEELDLDLDLDLDLEVELSEGGETVATAAEAVVQVDVDAGVGAGMGAGAGAGSGMDFLIIEPAVAVAAGSSSTATAEEERPVRGAAAEEGGRPAAAATAEQEERPAGQAPTVVPAGSAKAGMGLAVAPSEAAEIEAAAEAPLIRAGDGKEPAAEEKAEKKKEPKPLAPAMAAARTLDVEEEGRPAEEEAAAAEKAASRRVSADVSTRASSRRSSMSATSPSAATPSAAAVPAERGAAADAREDTRPTRLYGRLALLFFGLAILTAILQAFGPDVFQRGPAAREAFSGARPAASHGSAPPSAFVSSSPPPDRPPGARPTASRGSATPSAIGSPSSPPDRPSGTYRGPAASPDAAPASAFGSTPTELSKGAPVQPTCSALQLLGQALCCRSSLDTDAIQSRQASPSSASAAGAEAGAGKRSRRIAAAAAALAEGLCQALPDAPAGQPGHGQLQPCGLAVRGAMEELRARWQRVAAGVATGKQQSSGGGAKGRGKEGAEGEGEGEGEGEAQRRQRRRWTDGDQEEVRGAAAAQAVSAWASTVWLPAMHPLVNSVAADDELPESILEAHKVVSLASRLCAETGYGVGNLSEPVRQRLDKALADMAAVTAAHVDTSYRGGAADVAARLAATEQCLGALAERAEAQAAEAEARGECKRKCGPRAQLTAVLGAMGLPHTLVARLLDGEGTGHSHKSEDLPAGAPAGTDSRHSGAMKSAAMAAAVAAARAAAAAGAAGTGAASRLFDYLPDLSIFDTAVDLDLNLSELEEALVKDPGAWVRKHARHLSEWMQSAASSTSSLLGRVGQTLLRAHGGQGEGGEDGEDGGGPEAAVAAVARGVKTALRAAHKKASATAQAATGAAATAAEAFAHAASAFRGGLHRDPLQLLRAGRAARDVLRLWRSAQRSGPQAVRLVRKALLAALADMSPDLHRWLLQQLERLPGCEACGGDDTPGTRPALGGSNTLQYPNGSEVGPGCARSYEALLRLAGEELADADDGGDDYAAPRVGRGADGGGRAVRQRRADGDCRQGRDQAGGRCPDGKASAGLGGVAGEGGPDGELGPAALRALAVSVRRLRADLQDLELAVSRVRVRCQGPAEALGAFRRQVSHGPEPGASTEV